jgi:DNA topoisomerase-1
MNVDARDVNEYIQSVANFPYTAKDFRTWGGSLRAATVLHEIGTGKNENARKKDATMTVRIVSSELGNTPAICRKSYVHPVILTRYLRSGAKIELPAQRRRERPSPYGHTPEEKALIEFLDKHFPERRKAPRES